MKIMKHSKSPTHDWVWEVYCQVVTPDSGTLSLPIGVCRFWWSGEQITE